MLVLYYPLLRSPRELDPALDVGRAEDLDEREGGKEEGRRDDHAELLDLPPRHEARHERACEGEEDGHLDAEAGKVGAEGDDVAGLAVADLVGLDRRVEEEAAGALKK